MRKVPTLSDHPLLIGRLLQAHEQNQQRQFRRRHGWWMSLRRWLSNLL